MVGGDGTSPSSHRPRRRRKTAGLDRWSCRVEVADPAAGGSTWRVAALLVTGQTVVGDRLPGRRIGDELADARPDPRVTIERSHPDADRIGVAGVAAEQRRATVAAEPFLATAIRLPDSKPVLAGHDLKRAGRGVRAGRCCTSAATLAALAMAVAGDDQRLADLEPDGTAVAATGERELVHQAAPRVPRRQALADRPAGLSPAAIG